ncbi:glycosyltransferase family 2 protein [Methanosphaera sp.]
MVKVSVIMPVYNGEKYLDTSCQSLHNQTLNDIELICVNDGSTDNSLDKLKELSEKYDFIKIFNQENQGSGKARNKGIKEATGEYIAFLDADDIFVDENALEVMYNYGTENNADMVGGNLKRVAADGNLEDNFNYKHGNYAYFDKYDSILPENYGIPWAFYKNIFKKELLDKHNIIFPDLKRGQDPVFLAEILTKINKIYITPTDLYGYNYSSDGGANEKVNSYEKKLDYIKHFQETFTILENNQFNKISDKYKEKLFAFIKMPGKKDDPDFLKIIRVVFGYNVKEFNTFEEELLFLRLKLINYNDTISFTKNKHKIKEEIMKLNIKTTNIIDQKILKEYFNIISKNNTSSTSEDFTKKIENVTNENNQLSNNIDELTKEISTIKEENDELMSSLSWKITKPLRKLKKL